LADVRDGVGDSRWRIPFGNLEQRSGLVREPRRRRGRSLRGPFYRALFGDVLGGRQGVSDFETVRIVLDDPQKADEALTETNREATQRWFDNTLLSRLNDKAQGGIIIVMHRLHEDDLVGHVLKQQGWDVLSMLAIAEIEERHLIDGPLGRRFFVRRPGELFCQPRERRIAGGDAARDLGRNLCEPLSAGPDYVGTTQGD
jgi:hypothetical protein